ncbi:MULTISPECIES: patatin-like phospholipase family protein [Deefgea]|uniref:Patatin-like phospholipase family protein n=1 Tax=Deefgea chitinilytica TaxID=570276 RepID=A0ABS2C842_9NEIS|nr:MULTISPECIES: patatin-like phospholipase family protein [Deefgea]MBM5570316.1 patatin-like phospholipase family protein [Deefgea chitinilytica]MBM9887545.1 patatin-like phospholipase family protein [Deefgea sp. CFH1-16]
MKQALSVAPDTALILSGGGARAAYQVGVLLAIAHLLPQHAINPFPIICGTSAGAINAAAMAAGAAEFRKTVFMLARMWQGLHPEDIYRGSLPWLAGAAGHWLGALLLGGLGRYNPRAFLDNEPLRAFLSARMNFSQIQHNIDAGVLRAVSISGLGYTSGQSVSFFQAAPDLQDWARAKRIGVRTELNISHLMASSAIPLIFPAERIHREYFGDGSVRQIAPLSPAIHLGAKRVLVIGVAPNFEGGPARQRSTIYPTLAQVTGQLMNSVFLDSLDTDLERMMRINRTLSHIPEAIRLQSGLELRPIEVLTISPSQPLERLTLGFSRDFSLGMRFLLGGLGAFRRQGSVLASYLLFSGRYLRELIRLGYRDAMAKESELSVFLAANSQSSSVE